MVAILYTLLILILITNFIIFIIFLNPEDSKSKSRKTKIFASIVYVLLWMLGIYCVYVADYYSESLPTNEEIISNANNHGVLDNQLDDFLRVIKLKRNEIQKAEKHVDSLKAYNENLNRIIETKKETIEKIITYYNSKLKKRIWIDRIWGFFIGSICAYIPLILNRLKIRNILFKFKKKNGGGG